MKLYQYLNDPYAVEVDRVTSMIKELHADRETVCELQHHLLRDRLSDDQIRRLVQHFKDEGLTVTENVTDAGAPPMGWPDDGLKVIQYEIRWAPKTRGAQ